MRLENLSVRRERFGVYADQLRGTVKFSSEASTVEIVLGEELSQRIVQLCAEAIVEASHNVASLLVSDVIEDKALPEPDPDLPHDSRS